MENTRNQQLKNADAPLWRQVKAKAALADQTITEWIENLVKRELDGKKKT